MEYGEQVADTIANWVKNGFVAGPFDQPPLPNFRVNPLLAVDQGEKVRLVINMSSPKGLSFNDNVKQEGTEKVTMTSARNVSFTIVEAGKNALMSKLDKKDAYKLVPAPVEDLRLQGFSFGGKFFVETQQIFGSIKAVENFDRLGKTLEDTTVIETGTDPKWIHRQLDDVCCVSPASRSWCVDFTNRFLENCKELNIPLAKPCPGFEKAFTCSTYGKILGVFFDTKTLTWKLPDEKIQKTLSAIRKALETEKIELLPMQKLMGRLNDVSLMCPFLNGFKRPLNDILGSLQSGALSAELTQQAKRDLLVWAGFLTDDEKWAPICHKPVAPPLFRKEFTSDAAGAGKDSTGRVGCGNVGFDQDGMLFFASQIFWDGKNMLNKTDGKGASFRHKTTTLELIGTMLPFLFIPEKLANQHVVIKVDNIACFFGWENRSVNGDICASILIRALHLISAYLGCVVHFRHLPRMSTWDAKLADRLSRESTTLAEDRKLLSTFPPYKMPYCFEQWLKNPVEDFSLAESLLREIESVMNRSK
jgi:hypothetical protein